jgi:hypothetical protein
LFQILPSSSDWYVAHVDILLDFFHHRVYLDKAYIQDMMLHRFVAGVRTAAADLRLIPKNAVG